MCSVFRYIAVRIWSIAKRQEFYVPAARNVNYRYIYKWNRERPSFVFRQTVLLL